MAGLAEQVLDLPHSWVPDFESRRGRGKANGLRCELEQPIRVCAKVTTYPDSRIEVTVRERNLQRVADFAIREREIPLRRARTMPDALNEENRRRSIYRAQSKVRSLCLAMKADHMSTFGTRKTIPLGDLLTRWRRFTNAMRDYCESNSKAEFLYIGVPELHADGKHYHLHVATHGKFPLQVALTIWHALCSKDFPHVDGQSDVHGSINVKWFKSRGPTDDVPGCIASYISKYIGKVMDSDFNKRRYWASRSITPAEVNQIILKAKDFVQAQAELSKRLGFEWSSLILTRRGCVFVMPEDKGFWFKCDPDVARDGGLPF